MKNKHLLPNMFVWAAALVCAVWSLAGCSSPATGGAGDKTVLAAQLELESLQLAYADGSAPAGFVFNKDTFGYLLNVPEEYAGKELTVTVQAAAGAAVKITVDGTPVDAAFEVPQQGTANKTLVVAVSAGTHEAEYVVTFETAQLATMTDYSLKGIFASYTSSGTTNLASYKGGDQNGSIKVSDNTKNQAYVKATAGSGKSTIKMVYNGQEFSQSAGGGQAEGTITLPNRDTTASLDITVYSGDGKNSKTYGITVLGYVSQQVTWHGTAVYEGSDYEVSSVTARSGESVYTALLDQPVAGGWKWHFNASEFFKPTSFTMGLRKESGVDGETGQPVYTYKQSKSFTLGDLGRTGVTAAATESNPIAITVKGEQIGILIENANDLYKYLSSTDTTASYALGSNIDLSEYKDQNGNIMDWPGADNYAGKFYGNGYTIKLVLSKLSGDTGLFNTLKNGALLENFTVEVSSKASFATRTNSSHFGGIIGYIEQSNAVITIRNITVKGLLEIGSAGKSGYFLGGGLMGEVKNVGNLTIENCAALLDITSKNSMLKNMRGIGGLIGRIRFMGGSGTVTIRNSYSTGNIYSKNLSGDAGNIYDNYVGGLIGDIGTSGGGTYTVNISNCYASGDVYLESDVIAPNEGMNASGGLVGGIYYNNGTKLTVNIENSAAINEKALFSANNTTNVDYKSNGRFAGYRPNTDGKLVLGFTGNIARSGMLIGNPDAPQADNAPDTADEATNAVVQTGLRGIGKTTTELNSESLWTNTLGWSKDLWDFSGLAAGTWPTLKPVGASN